MVRFLLLTIVRFFKYINIGFFFTIFTFINIIVTSLYYFWKFVIFGFVYLSIFVYRTIRYVFLGFLVISRYFYRFLRYVGIGFIAPFVILFRFFIKLNEKQEKATAKRQLEQQKRILARERNKQIKEENRKRLEELKSKEKEIEEKKKQERKENVKKEKAKTDIYINENLTLEKKKFSDYLNIFFLSIGKIPNKIKSLFTNNSFVKNAKNKKDINRQALLLDFEGADAEKSEEKIMYKYVARKSVKVRSSEAIFLLILKLRLAFHFY